MTLSLLYWLGYKSVLALSGAEVLRVACEPNKQFALIAGSQRLLRDQRLSSWRWWSKGHFLTFYKGKLLKGATSEVVRETAGRTRHGLTLGTSISASTRPSWRQSYIAMSCGNNARVEGLDVTLDSPAGLYRRVLMNGWMWVRDSSEVEFRLGPLVLHKV